MSLTPGRLLGSTGGLVPHVFVLGGVRLAGWGTEGACLPWSGPGGPHVLGRSCVTLAAPCAPMTALGRGREPGRLSARLSSRGHKRKLNEEDAASESSRESSCEDEGSSSEADEMAAALEAELDLM